MKSVALVLGMFVVGGALAHHSLAVNFDQSREVTIEGRLTDAAWRNPHSHLRVVTPDTGGTEWLVEFGAINTMRRMNFETDRFVVGELISITGWPGHRERTLYYLEATLEDGTRLICAGPSCSPDR